MSTYSLEHKEYLYRIRREKIIVTIFRIFIILLFLSKTLEIIIFCFSPLQALTLQA